MIWIPIELCSARGHQYDKRIGAILIDNISGGGNRRDYRVRAFRAGTTMHDIKIRKVKPIREGKVTNHAANSLPVSTLLKKALEEMGY